MIRIASLTYLLPLLLLISSAAAAGGPTRASYPADTLDYYLFSAYLEADSADRPRLHHIGAIYQQHGDAWYISNLLEGYPAVRAGLRRGDRILSVNGKPFHPVHSFNGPAATAAQNAAAAELTIVREGQEQTFHVTPVHENLYDAYRNATQHSISRYPSGNKLVCYVHWWSASRSLSDLIADRQLFGSLRLCDALVLDLRDAYGWFDWQHLDHFYGSRRGYPVLEISSESGGQRKAAEPAAEAGRYFGRPIAVLVNEGTRAGMELLAWELIDSRRALSVGQPSAGLITGTAELVRDGEMIRHVHAGTLRLDGQPVQRAEPELLQPWPLGSAGRTDPQFDAALFALMGII